MMEPASSSPSPIRGPVWKEQPLNFKKTLSRVFLNWPWFLLSLLLFLFLAFLVNHLARPVYEARTTLLFETDRIPTTGNEALGSDVFQGLGRVGSMRNIYDQSVMLVSTPLVEKALGVLGFEVSYYALDRKGAVEIYREAPFTVLPDKRHVQPAGLRFDLEITPRGQYLLTAHGKEIPLFDYSRPGIQGVAPEIHLSGTYDPGSLIESPWYAFTLTPVEDSNPQLGQKYRFVLHTPQQLVEQYKEQLKADIPEEKSSIVELSVSGNNIAKAIDFLDKLTQVYQEDNLARKNNNASRTIDFISEQLQTMSDSLMISQNELQQFRARTQVMDLSLQTPILLEQMNTLDQEKMVLETKNKYYAYLKEYIGSNQDLESIIAPSAMGVDDPLLNNLVMELNRLVVTKSSLPSIRNSDHPQLKAINAQIEQIKSTLLENANNILTQSQISLADLNARLRVAQARVNALPATERNYVNIERKYKLNNEILTFLLQKFSEAQIAKASNLPDSQVIEPAYFWKMVFPKRQMNYLFALVLAFLVPLFILYLKDYFSDIVSSEEDIRAITALPILGNIYRNKKANNTITLVLDKPNSPASELYRAIRGKLSLITADRRTPVIAVTSTFPNEGKTYNAINIASSFALMKRKTVLVDFDLRNSVFGEIFGIPGDKGLIGYIKGECSLSEITYPSKHPALDLIPAGPKPPDPGDILAGENIMRLLQELREKYEMVIIDNLPVGLVADLFQLREEIDATVFVVRHGFTRRSTFRKALVDVATHKMKNVGILVNGIEVNKELFGYGYNHDYIYGYGEKNGQRVRRNLRLDDKEAAPSQTAGGERKMNFSGSPGSTPEKDRMWGRIRNRFLSGSRNLLIMISFAIILMALLIVTFVAKDTGHAEERCRIIPAAVVPARNSDLLPAIAPHQASIAPVEEITVHTAQGSIIRKAPQKGVYYAVAKSLENQQQAEEYAQSMLSEGYQPRILGKIGKYYFVALDTFLKKKEAFSAVQRLKESNVAGEAWVYFHP
jgi:capsular exopolysaccharide synthesis family protein